MRNATSDLTSIETELLLNGIRARYGYDFTHYSSQSLSRRLEKARTAGGAKRLSELLDHILHDRDAFDAFLKCMSVSVTEMFRDPAFYRALRSMVLPRLKTFPFAKIWHAGCATGEEAYSMAIVLYEEEFLDRTRIYATDFNIQSIDIAQAGVYDVEKMQGYEAGYKAAHGTKNFRDYYSARYGCAKLKDFLRERIMFSYHNLVTDGIFGEMNLICCRNVLIYFDRALQEKVLKLFAESLRFGGFLCLGSRETLNFTAVLRQFEVVDERQRIYRKRRITA